MRSFGRVLLVARRYAAWFAVSVVSMVLVAGSTVFAYNLIRPIYDDVLGSGPAVEEAEAERPMPGIVGSLDRVSDDLQQRIQGVAGGSRAAVLVLVVIAVGVKNLFTFLARYSTAQLGLSTIRDLRDMIFDKLLVQSQAFFQGQPSGVIVSRVVNDVRMIHEALAERFGDTLQDSLTIVVLLVYAFSLNFRLALATVLLGPILIAPVVHFSRRLRRRSRQAQERMGDLASVLDEALRGIRVVQAFGMESFERDRFRSATQRHFWSTLKARAIQMANAPVMEVVGALAFAGLIAYASHQIARGTMTLGDFSAFVIAMYGAYNPIKRLNKFNLAVQQATVAAERVFDVIDAPVTVSDLPDAVDLEDVSGGVELRDVDFAYEDEAWVLRDFSLKIPEGRTVALVGPSGAGKSTVAQLIPRFWDVQHGAVLVGGRDVRDVTLASLRARIGIVTQETILFNDTVWENIVFGRRGVSREAVEAAAEAANATEFIRRFPRGFETVIGEGGSRLSGGQRQRLAIARALFKDPPILILDEATSALDPEAERLVQEALENLMRGRTTLVIAHRLATVRRVDEIVVLDDGRIVERGTHDELLAADGRYAALVAMQELT